MTGHHEANSMMNPSKVVRENRTCRLFGRAFLRGNRSRVRESSSFCQTPANRSILSRPVS
jgi:hypothetical protein